MFEHRYDGSRFWAIVESDWVARAAFSVGVIFFVVVWWMGQMMATRARMATSSPAAKPAKAGGDSAMNVAMRRTWLDVLEDAVAYSRWLANR